MTVAAGRDLLERGVRACERRGYAVTRPESGRDPPALAEPTAETRAFAADRPVAVEPLPASAVTPTTLVSRLWDDVDRGRAALFVVPADCVDEARAVLTDPPFVAERSVDGRRTFYSGPDRVPLAGGGYALARPAGEYRWSEEPASEVRRDAAAEDGTRLVLRAGNDPIAVLPDVDALARPSAELFPFSYARGGEGSIRVRSAAGEPVYTADGVRALGTAGFEPVPMPLVPEHVFADPAVAAESWTVLGAER
ncbi:MAG: hypothetical protein ABEJ43_00945 [Haloferacaceae archaeon]